MNAPHDAIRALDPSGFLDEAFHDVGQAVSRRELLGGAVAAAAGSLLFAHSARAAALPAGDVAILNYALGLEYLQSAFYTEAERLGKLRGQARLIARTIGAVERAHVDAFRAALGSKAAKSPFFNFRDVTGDGTSFLRTAVAFEDLAVAAYKGQAPLIQSNAVLQTALAIHSVEARHAAWTRQIGGVQPAARAFDEARPRAEFDRIVASTGFVKRRPKTNVRRRPKFTG